MKPWIAEAMKQTCVLMLALLAMHGLAWAQVSVHDVRMHAQSEVRLVDDEWAGGQGERSSGLWCQPGASTTNGHCISSIGSDRDTALAPGGGTPILLDFTERRSGVRQTITLLGRKTLSHNGVTQTYALDTPLSESARGELRYSFLIPGREMAKIPFGGVWSARLALRALYGTDGGGGEVPWLRQFVLNVTDNDNIQIYRITPHSGPVDLNLRPAGHENLTGHALIRTCLYDGFNANSGQYRLTMHGDAAHGGGFAVHSEDGRASLPYQVRVTDPGGGAMRSVKAHEILIFNNGSHADVRVAPITLLGSGRTGVYCTPWDITLTVPPFKHLDQAAGHYRGDLTILFSPSVSTTTF